MADGTKIEWTDATWNPITGCSVVSPGCTNCYAMKLAGTRLKNHPSRKGLTKDTKAGPVWTGEVRFNAEWLDQPLRWTKPRMIFVCAHGDLFAEGVPDEWIDQVFAVMALCPQHTFQVLTKRPERMREYLRGDENASNDEAHQPHQRILNAAYKIIGNPGRFSPVALHLRSLCEASEPPLPLPNVWLGVSVEDQRRAEERIPILLDTPAAIRWISAEPLLGPVDLVTFLGGTLRIGKIAIKVPAVRIDWVVAGGESGPGARPMHPDWARSLREQCAAAGVPLLFKQWGEWREAQEGDRFDTSKGRMQSPPAFIVSPRDGTVHCFLPADHDDRFRVMLEVGKRRAGRLLDGVEHNGYPEPRHA